MTIVKIFHESQKIENVPFHDRNLTIIGIAFDLIFEIK